MLPCRRARTVAHYACPFPSVTGGLYQRSTLVKPGNAPTPTATTTPAVPSNIAAAATIPETGCRRDMLAAARNGARRQAVSRLWAAPGPRTRHRARPLACCLFRGHENKSVTQVTGKWIWPVAPDLKLQALCQMPTVSALDRITLTVAAAIVFATSHLPETMIRPGPPRSMSLTIASSFAPDLVRLCAAFSNVRFRPARNQPDGKVPSSFAP